MAPALAWEQIGLGFGARQRGASIQTSRVLRRPARPGGAVRPRCAPTRGGWDRHRPEFSDLQREEDAALAGIPDGPLRSPSELGAGVPMEGPRRISERGKKALLEEMMKRNGM